MHVESLVLGAFETNCFVVWNQTAEALIVDPADDAPAILGFLNARHLSPSAILLTHGHVDHISAAAEIADSTGAVVYLHDKDREWAFSEFNSFPPWYPAPKSPAKAVVPFPPDGETITIAGIRLKVMWTPGHTPGSVCLLAEKGEILFSGDTLFAGSVGRTDLPGGNSRQLALSLKKLSSLQDALVVYPGHGPKTTIERERATNFFLRTEGIF